MPLLLLPALVLAQPVPPKPYDTMFFQTKLGSCKFINGEGKLQFAFTGTVLLNRVDGTAKVTGNVRKEYDGNGRQTWFGTGQVVVEGKFRAIQWFGRNLSGQWTGNGLARFVGEFDRDLKTGEYWYASNPTREAWGTFREPTLPPRTIEKPKPIDRDTLKKKGGG